MKRKIIEINEEKCNGCRACADACHEGAIGMINGKAKLLRDDYCDGLGDCLPACPTDAISFVEREAAPYDEKAVAMKKMNSREFMNMQGDDLPCGCAGSQSKQIVHDECGCEEHHSGSDSKSQQEYDMSSPKIRSQLSQWPVQIKLAPINAPYFNNSNLLVAADCTAFAYGDFHNTFIKNKITLVGCPKLDDVDYSDKLTEIIAGNNIKSVTVVRMEVPCCGGIENAVKNALQASGKFIPWQVVTISTDGRILD